MFVLVLLIKLSYHLVQGANYAQISNNQVLTKRFVNVSPIMRELVVFAKLNVQVVKLIYKVLAGRVKADQIMIKII